MGEEFHSFLQEEGENFTRKERWKDFPIGRVALNFRGCLVYVVSLNASLSKRQFIHDFSEKWGSGFPGTTVPPIFWPY